MSRVKSRLGIGQEDRYRYGAFGGPTGVISVAVPNYQRQQQHRRQHLQSAQLTGQPLPNLPTPFAAAQVPLPDDDELSGSQIPHSRAGSIQLRSNPKILVDVVGGTMEKRMSLPLHRQSLVPGQATVAPLNARLGSAPPGSNHPSMPPLPDAAVAPRYQSAPGIGELFIQPQTSLCIWSHVCESSHRHLYSPSFRQLCVHSHIHLCLLDKYMVAPFM